MKSQVGTRLEVNLTALADNYRFLRGQVAKETLFMGVVKANAYGHDIVRISQELQDLGADYLAVAYVEEGVTLRQAGITLPILVLHAQQHSYELCIEKCLEPVIYRFEMLEEFHAFVLRQAQHELPSGKAESIPYPVHIEFNTGMNRLGIEHDRMQEVKEKLKELPHLKVRGVLSHLAASEDLKELEFTKKQLNLFEELANSLQSELGYQLMKHQSNTSAILNFHDAHFDMVRSGIGLYGYGNDARFEKQLTPVARLVSQISVIKTVESGESISYNRQFIAQRKTRYAVIGVGHGDGIDRRHGNGVLQVLIRGEKAATLGVICMDMFMVDVSHITDAQVGDEVIIFGPENPADELAENAGTISYELVTGMRNRVKRVYISE